MFKEAGFLGTGATLGSDLTLIAQVLLYITLCVGIVAQMRRAYKWHDRLQTTVVVANFFFIIFIMMSAFAEQRVASTLPQRPRDPYYLSAAVHGSVGLIAQGLATYALLAGHKILPRRIGRLRYWMWATFFFWTAAFALGITTYYTWYVRQADGVVLGAVAADGTPTQQALLQNFTFVPADLTVVAGSTVVWLNQDAAPHNVTFDDGNGSDNFFQGETFAFTFDTVGEFGVYCTLHGNPGSGMAGVVRVVAATGDDAPAVAAQPTPLPPPPTPTPAPPLPPPPLAPLEPPEPEQRLVGLLVFMDTYAPGDTAVLDLIGLESPAAGQKLVAWLTGPDNQMLPIGELAPDATGHVFHTYLHPEQQNLLALYDGVHISLEPGDAAYAQPGNVIYSGRLSPQALIHIRTITVQAGVPGDFGLAIAARLQAEELLRHVEYVQLAYDLLSIADAQRHAEHIINIIEGEQGPYFGDHDGKHGIQNPGDGFGLIRYLDAMDQAAQQAAAAPDSTRAVRLHATHIAIATANARAWAENVRQAALEIVELRRIGDIEAQVAALNEYGRLLLWGHDDHGHFGYGEVPPENGGILTAYQHAQYMAAIPVSTANPAPP
jgi:plastocyanin